MARVEDGMAGDVVRIGAVADVHYGRDAGKRSCGRLFEQAARQADVLLLGGDLTDFGLPEEAAGAGPGTRRGAACRSSAVLGNHDYEAGKEQEVRRSSATGHEGAGRRRGRGPRGRDRGVKGFGGGFGRGTLEPWGEPGSSSSSTRPSRRR